MQSSIFASTEVATVLYNIAYQNISNMSLLLGTLGNGNSEVTKSHPKGNDDIKFSIDFTNE